MKHRHLLVALGLLASFAALGAPAAAKPAEVFPWCGDGAVLAADVGFGPRNQVTALSGRADDPKLLAVAFSAEPESWVRVQTRDRRGSTPDGHSWELPLRDAGADARKAMFSGRPFDVLLGLKQRRTEPDRLLGVFGLVVAPVWALVVDPEADRHQLPNLTAYTSNTVRVLSFTGGLTAGHCSGWMTAGEAKAAGMENFCGLARTFANDISSQGKGVVGLVLVPKSLLPPNLPPGQAVEKWAPSRSNEDDPLLHAALRAVGVANYDDRSGAHERRRRAIDAHKKLQQDAKREGKVLEGFPTGIVLWKEIFPGDQDFLPFRVNGLVR